MTIPDRLDKKDLRVLNVRRIVNNALDSEYCIMSYHESKKHLCGRCRLRLRGWLYSGIKNDGTDT